MGTEPTEVNNAESTSEPWRWPAQWFKDEKFWREVASRTVSGIIVVTLGFMAAMLMGLFPDSHLRSVRLAFAVLSVLLVGLHSAIMLPIVSFIAKNLTGKRRKYSVWVIAFGSVFILYAFLVWMWLTLVPS